MVDLIKVECKYCGSFIDLSKAIKLNVETGEYEYLCTNCAIKFKKNSEPNFSEKSVSDEKIDN
jgi:DNA-directed RNA polymerase subunit RPC12/RpoP